MTKKVPLKNSEEHVLLDEKIYNALSKEPRLKKLDFLGNLRRHSSGCAVFQKVTSNKKKKGVYKTETIYLHRFIGEKFLSKDKSKVTNLVGAKNGNKLDCRLENLEWRSRATASRNRKTTSKSGYTGVYEENGKFRAVISIDRRTRHIGVYSSAEEAAMAYNKKSRELYGASGKLNIIKA